jgi:tetratricopeptide (TPR) repeat protein
MKWKVLIAHAEGEDDLAEKLAEPIRDAGYDTAHRGTVMIGESFGEEAQKVLGEGGPVVICGTVRAIGTGLAHRLVQAARGDEHQPRIFAVKMEKDAYVQQLSLDTAVAHYWENPAKATQNLIAALKKYYPLDDAAADSHGKRSAPFLLDLGRPSRKLVGRDKLLDELKGKLFAEDQSYCKLALKGLPGVGKTALAVELAYYAHERLASGVLWAGLNVEENTLDILGNWLIALGISAAEVKNLTTIEERKAKINASVGAEKMLLVVDDVLSAEAAENFILCKPRCLHLITTHVPSVVFDLDAEQVDVNELSEADGLALLRARAPEAVKADPDKARELVNAVGGLPQALILIGNYLRKSATGGQKSRLTEAFDELLRAEAYLNLHGPNQISLEAAIKTSYDVLDEVSREALLSLSVFPAKPNSFSRDAALAVTAASSRSLNKLFDYGLLEAGGEDKYTLHKTISDAARSMLKDTHAYQRMVDFFVAYVRKHGTDYHALNQETANILAALRIASERLMGETQVRAANAFYPFLEIRGLYELAEKELRLAKKAAEDLNEPDGLTTTLLYLGCVAEKHGDYTTAIEHLAAGLGLARPRQDFRKISALLQTLGVVEFNRSNLNEAETHLKEGLEAVRANEELDNHDAVVVCKILRRLGLVERQRGNYAEAERYFKKGLILARFIKDDESISSLLTDLGSLAVLLQDYDAAEVIAKEGLEVAQSMDNPERIAAILQIQSRVESSRGNHERAEELLRQSLEYALRINHQWYITFFKKHLGELYLQQKEWQKAAENFTEAAQIAEEKLGSHDLWGEALYGLARVAAERGNISEARLKGQKSLDMLEKIHHYAAPEVRKWLASLPTEGAAG